MGGQSINLSKPNSKQKILLQNEANSIKELYGTPPKEIQIIESKTFCKKLSLISPAHFSNFSQSDATEKKITTER